MPRGGVPVAAEVAYRLNAPLDIIVVRKLGCPGQPELGIGAIAEGGVRMLNEALIAEAGVDERALESVTAHEHNELDRRVALYRAGHPQATVEGRVAIVIDDGLATGYTARAAIEALRRQGASRVVLAVPVAAEETAHALRTVADEVVALDTPPYFFGIGEFYEDFSQTTDEEVIEALKHAAAAAPLRAAAAQRASDADQ